MNISKETIEHIAHLARLPITAEDELFADVSRIIEYMSALPEGNETESTPALHSLLREDEVGKCCPVDTRLFSVPKAVK